MCIRRYSNKDLVDIYEKLPFVDTSGEIKQPGYLILEIIMLLFVSLTQIYPPLPDVGPGQAPKGYPQPGAPGGGSNPIPDCKREPERVRCLNINKKHFSYKLE